MENPASERFIGKIYLVVFGKGSLCEGSPSFLSAVIQKQCGEAVLHQQAYGLGLAAIVINTEFVDFSQQVVV